MFACLFVFCFFFFRRHPLATRPSVGLLRLQQIYQELKPGNETFRVQMVKRIANVTMAIEFLHTMEDLGRFSKKRIVLDCPAEMAKEIIIQHVRDVKLGRRTYHYLLSGLVSAKYQKTNSVATYQLWQAAFTWPPLGAFNKQLLPASARLCYPFWLYVVLHILPRYLPLSLSCLLFVISLSCVCA